MTAISMLPGLAIVVFLSVVGPVWMATDLSNCTFPNAKMKNMMGFFNGLPHKHTRYYVTHQSSPLRPGTVSTLVVLLKRGMRIVLWESSLVKGKDGKITCNHTKSALNIAPRWNRVTNALKLNGLQTKHHLLYVSPDLGKIAALTRFYNKDGEIKSARHVAFATRNPADLFKVANIIPLVNKICGYKLKLTLSSFEPLDINTSMKRNCI